MGNFDRRLDDDVFGDVAVVVLVVGFGLFSVEATLPLSSFSIIGDVVPKN